MRKQLQRWICSLAALVMAIIYAGAVQAKPHEMVKADKIIRNLNQVIEQVKTKSKLRVFFPAYIPKGKQTILYAMQESLYNKPDYNKYWEISVTTSQGCETHGCIIGSLSANTDGTLEKVYMRPPFGNNKKPLHKQVVKLDNGLSGYFTPGHAEADWHPPAIEWQSNQVLYTLTWDMAGDAKPVLVKMANSALKSK